MRLRSETGTCCSAWGKLVVVVGLVSHTLNEELETADQSHFLSGTVKIHLSHALSIKNRGKPQLQLLLVATVLIPFGLVH